MRPPSSWAGSPAILLLLALVFAAPARAQLWSGYLDSSRAIDWSGAGVSGGIPTRTTICSTLSPGATAAQINTAITNCAAGQVVFLEAGTYNLAAGITFAGRSDVTLRGAGASQTKLIFTGDVGCRGFGASICLGADTNPQMPAPGSTTTWTAGYAKGTTVITVGSATGISAGSLLILDQTDDSSDGGEIFICSAITTCSDEGGNAYGRAGRAQQELVKVASVAGTNITLDRGLHMPNWASGKSPGVSFASSKMSGDGVEDLSIDNTSSGGQSGIVMLYISDSWVKGVRSIVSNRNHVWLYQAARMTIRDNYFYGSLSAASQSYGVEWFSAGDILVENNIGQHVAGPVTINGGGTGSVIAYNFFYDDFYSVSANWMIPSMIHHESGEAFDLFEGNSGPGWEGDAIHGTHHFMTLFRNYLPGDLCACPAKTNNTDLIHLFAFSRYYNVIGNVLGRAGYYDTYEQNLTGSPTDIYTLGDGGPVSDANVKTTLYRWGNFDNVTGAIRWCGNSGNTGWTTTCSSTSEVPTGLANYAQAVPSSETLPASFYLAAQPAAWWGSPYGAVPWPPIGPGVSGGDQLFTSAYKTPAELCWANAADDGAYTAGTVRVFNAASCYEQISAKRDSRRGRGVPK